VRFQRADIIGVAALLVLAHGIVLAGELLGLRLRLDHSLNAALLVTNLYILYSAYLIAPRLTRLKLALYVLGYAALFYLFFLYNPAWRPLFFLYALVYGATYRLPLAFGLFVIFLLANSFAQPYPFPAFLAAGSVFAAAYEARRRSRQVFRVICLGAGLLVFMSLLFPIICFVLGDSIQTLVATYRRPDVSAALRTSLASSGLTTVCALLFGVPLAYALARLTFPGKSALESAIDLPIVVPQSAVGIAFLWVLGEKGPLGGVLHLPGTMAGIVVAQLFVSAPFLIRTSQAAFQAVDVGLENVARTLGATEWSAFWRVALPLAAPGVYIGIVLAWARAISEVGAVAMLSYRPLTAPILVFERGSQAGLEQARPVAALAVASCVWIFIGLHLIRTAAFRRWVVGGE